PHRTRPSCPTRRSSDLAKPATGSTPADVIRKARDAGVQVVDLKFTDLPGTWQHFSIPLKELTDELFKEGIGFDGSSIRGFQAIRSEEHTSELQSRFDLV